MGRPDQSAPERLHLLPIPTDRYEDVVTVLAALASDRIPRIDVLIGPDDAGKSATLRHLIHAYRRTGGSVRLLDLSLHEWRALLGEPSMDVAFVDHLDRISGDERFQTAFTILERVLPAMFSAGLSRLMLTLSVDWRARFRRAYGINPETVLRTATPAVRFQSHLLRPYTSAETLVLCTSIGLDDGEFTDPSLRRPGVLAMASSLARDHVRMNGPCLRDLLVRRWLEAVDDPHTRAARRAMWELLGTLTLRHEPFALSHQELCSALPMFRRDTLRAQEGGPFRWEGDQVQSDSPAWGDVAAARELQNAIEGTSTGPVRQPLRASVLRALVDLSDRRDLKVQVNRTLKALRGTSFAERGYLGPIMGTLSAELSADAALIFRGLSLQGPDQAELRPVAPEVAAAVQQALLEAMLTSVDGLIDLLRNVRSDARSGYGGDYDSWTTARAWASALPLRASAEDAVLNLLPTDGSWRYEDILDVSVTGATTRFMAHQAAALASSLARLPSAVEQYLADIWDGINDGAWDQIDSRSSGFIASLYLPQPIAKPLTAVGCRMQRAHFGSQDARGWRLLDCDLLLADLRSCRNVELVDFAGSNWWSAILPPPARYHHSRRCHVTDFLDWCQSPPWVNPYYTHPWPTPFG